MIVDPSQPESLYLANLYLSKRDIPRGNVLYMKPDAANYQAFAAQNLKAFLGSLQQRDLEHIDYVIVPPGGNFFVPAAGYINDLCSPVNRFTIVTGYTLAYQSDAIFGGLVSTARNHYAKTGWGARAFESDIRWNTGTPSEDESAERYYIGAMLGYTGTNGNTLQDVIDMIDRSVASDFTQPAGTVYYVETSDVNRSGPRHDLYPDAVLRMANAGGVGQHLLGVLPTGQHDCMGVMTGWASPNIDGEVMTLLPGSFADHLTSFAGNFSTTSQTKMSRWIAKGASGTAGTVEEPCNYATKFPNPRVHVVYRKGLSLGEAWFRSNGSKPFQSLFYGDPLTRPYALPPTVDLPGLPGTPVSGSALLTPTANATAPGASIAAVHLHIDGIKLETIASGGSFQLDTSLLADGPHELRVVAEDDSLQSNKGSFIGTLAVDNHGHSVAILPSATSGDLATAFDVIIGAAAGAGSGTFPEQTQLLHNGRVVASTPLSDGTLRVYGQNLGAGPARIVAVTRYLDGSRARSATIELDIAYSGSLPVGATPIAYDATIQVDPAHPALIELPGAHGELLSSTTTTLLQSPAQATVLMHGSAYVMIEASPMASGTDVVIFRIDSLAGSSNTANVLIEYVPACTPPTNICVTAANSVGAGMLMSHMGSASESANDMELVAATGPVGQSGIFYYGMGSTQQSFGDGFRCVGGSSYRLPVLAIDGAGEAHFALDLSQPPVPAGQIAAGQTWNFQFWYRDPAAGGTGFNLSDALQIEFCP